VAQYQSSEPNGTTAAWNRGRSMSRKSSAVKIEFAGLEHVPQVSMSTSSRLSIANDYPSFFRLVAPDDDRGQVGALVSVLAEILAGTVLVLNTDTPYTKDLLRT
jgi:hypothetical protein